MSEIGPGAWAGSSYLLSTGFPSLETVLPGRQEISMNCLRPLVLKGDGEQKTYLRRNPFSKNIYLKFKTILLHTANCALLIYHSVLKRKIIRFVWKFMYISLE